MWKEIPPFSFSAGERKLMTHFVVNPTFLILVAARRSRSFGVVPSGRASRCLFLRAFAAELFTEKLVGSRQGLGCGLASFFGVFQER